MRRNTSTSNQPRYSVSRRVFLLFMVSFAGADGMGPCLAVTAVGTLVAATVLVRKSSRGASSEQDAPIEITKKSPMQQWAKQFQDDWKKKHFLGSRGGRGVRDGEEWDPDFLFESRRGSSSFSVILHSPAFLGGSSMLIPSAIRSKRQARKRKSAAAVGSTAGCIARIELRLSRFGSMEPTRDALRALSREIDQADAKVAAEAAAAEAAPALAWLQGGQKAERKTGKGGLPLSTTSSSSPSSSSSKHSDKPKSTFSVLVDMTTSVACSPAVLNVVVSFMRTYGGRFGHVSLVGRSAAMDMARLCISLARLNRFRVFPDFAELQKALDEGTWEI